MKLIYNILLLTLVLLSSLSSFGQYGFQKVYDHQAIDTFSIISDIYLEGSTPYITLGSGRAPNRMDFRFGTVNQEGDYQNIIQHSDPGELQHSMFSNVETDTNFRGNLVNCYKNSSSFENNFRLIEYGFDGLIHFDSIYSNFWTIDSIAIFDYSKLMHLSDSSYLLNLNYIDKKTTSSTFEVQGTMLLKVNQNGEIEWIKKIYNSTHPQNPVSSGRNLIKIKEDTFVLHIMESKHQSPSNAEQNWARHKFLTIDVDGNILGEKQFQDGQLCYSYYGSYFDKDTTYLQYYDSKLFGNPPNNDYFKLKPMLSRIDENMDTVWRIKLSSSWLNAAAPYSSIQKINKINDTTFVAAYQHTEEIEPNLNYKITVRILNFSSTGNVNWYRDYYYYNIDLFNDPEYEIKDLEIMPDNGFIMGGQVFNYDFYNDDVPFQFAYLLRTNCLGFLSPPQAQFSYESDETEVVFTNNSMNAGSYTYYFGDGDSLSTGEDVDSVTYTYETGGDYEVTLIAHGCNGEADTVKLQVNIEGNDVGNDEEEINFGNIGDNYFTIYPNPVQQGNLITVETGNVDNAQLQFYDSQGRLLKTVPLPSAKSIYFIEHNFAAGEYIVQLNNKSKVLQHKKMVVQ